TTVITKASNLAYQKGMLVLNSAGNSGNSPWRYIGAPADGYGVFSIGSVNGNEVIAGSSSHGFPWSDDVKPNVVARGSGAYGYSIGSASITQSSGTSFSCPVISGMSACLWSANPNLSPFWIKQAIEKSADRLLHPDTLYGYGLPNYQMALNILDVNNQIVLEQNIQLLPNPVMSNAFVRLKVEKNTDVELRIYNIQGALVKQKNIKYFNSDIPINVTDLSSGVYILEAKTTKLSERIKFTKI
ncbi:MAG: S8 family peptidase, partial [Bacteroidales bacterium]|nr:S8 family peptidase [Bacteroidales bacterium]